MEIKIQPGKSLPNVDVSDEAASLDGTPSTVETSPESVDAVTAIATDLIEAKIDANKAVDLLIQHTMGSDMIAVAPKALRAEIEQALRSAIETDPHLISLTQKL